MKVTYIRQDEFPGAQQPQSTNVRSNETKQVSALSDHRKQQMKRYILERRKRERELNADRIAARKVAKAELAAKRAKIRADKQNAVQMEKRRAARLAGRPDLRTKQYRPAPKPKEPRPVPTLKKGRKIVPKKQPKQMVTRKENLSDLIRIRIDHKTEIFIKPGTDPEAAKQRYLDRKMKF